MNDSHVPNVPLLQAVALGRVKEAGRSRPIAINCSRVGDLSIVEYIVKLYGDLDFGKHSLARELLGSLLASYFNLTTPEPAIIDISRNLAENEDDPDIAHKLVQSLGYNFGSKTIETGAFSPVSSLSDEALPQAVSIICFDSLIMNSDRRPEKPNMFETREGYIVFDHELAFPYSNPQTMLGGVPNPWELSGTNATTIRNHFFYKDLSESDLNFDPFINKLKELDDVTLDEMINKLPIEWRTDQLDPIVRYISTARENADLMKKGLQEILG